MDDRGPGHDKEFQATVTNAPVLKEGPDEDPPVLNPWLRHRARREPFGEQSTLAATPLRILAIRDYDPKLKSEDHLGRRSTEVIRLRNRSGLGSKNSEGGTAWYRQRRCTSPPPQIYQNLY